MPEEKKEITNATLAKSIEAFNTNLTTRIETLTQTVEKLAIMTVERFEQVDLRFGHIDSQIELLAESMNLMRDDMHDLKMNMSPLVQTSIVQERDIDNLKDRVTVLEHKVAV